MLFLPIANAVAAGSVNLTYEDGAVSYSFDLPKEKFVLLTYTAPQESGKTVLYAEDGSFQGKFDLLYSDAGGKLTVKVTSLDKDAELAKGTLNLPAEPGYAAPKGKASGKVKDLQLEETAAGVRYSFTAPDTDYVKLHVRSKPQSVTFPVYPGENGVYAGEVALPLTYARTMITVQVLSAKDTVLAEAQARKGYEAPEAPEKQEGRLSGVTVCIDPGHQENGHLVKEPLGPGLTGSTTGTSGMAQGTVTQRKEAIVVLEIGMALRDELLRQGANVVMTRETQDVFHTNQERCQIAADANAHIMLRLHADTRENKSKQGFSVYAPLNSDYARAVADPKDYRAMGELLMKDLKDSVGYAQEDKYGIVQLNDQFVGNNWAQMTCFLVELGFLSNQKEDYLLSHPVYQQWLAQGMSQGVYDIAVFRGWLQP